MSTCARFSNGFVRNTTAGEGGENGGCGEGEGEEELLVSVGKPRGGITWWAWGARGVVVVVMVEGGCSTVGRVRGEGDGEREATIAGRVGWPTRSSVPES